MPSPALTAALLLSTSLLSTTNAQQPQPTPPGQLNAQPATASLEPASPTQAPAALEPAQDASPAFHHADDRWHLDFRPGVWYGGFSGRLSMPRIGGGGSLGPGVKGRQLNLNSPRVSPFAELNLTKNNWLIELRGFGFSTERQTQADAAGSIGNIDFDSGDSLQTSVDFQSLEIQGGYRIYSDAASPLPAERGGGHKLVSNLYALAGVRLMNMETTFESLDPATTSQDYDSFSAHPTLGLKWKVDFYNDFTITAEVNGGLLPFSDDESYGFDIVIGGQWRPTEHIGLQIGYRALFFGLATGEEDNQFEWTDASVQGLYAGITFTF